MGDAVPLFTFKDNQIILHPLPTFLHQRRKVGKRRRPAGLSCVLIRLFAGNGNLLTQKLKSQIACSANNGLLLLTCFSPWCSPIQFYDEKQVF
jgi:hypothetical protein